MPRLMLVLIIVLWVIALVQPGGVDFLRASTTTINGHVVRVLDTLIALGMLVVMVVLRGPAIVVGLMLFAFWGLSLFGHSRLDGVPVTGLAVVAVVIGGIAQSMSHWAKR